MYINLIYYFIKKGERSVWYFPMTYKGLERETAGISRTSRTFWKEWNLQFWNKMFKWKSYYRKLCFVHNSPFHWAFQVCNSQFPNIEKYSDRVFCRMIFFKSYGNPLSKKWKKNKKKKVKEELVYYDSLSYLLSISLISVLHFEWTLITAKGFTTMTLCQLFRIKILSQKHNVVEN